MVNRTVLHPILVNENITRGLGDPEACLLFEWLVEKAEELGDRGLTEVGMTQQVNRLCLRARAIGRFVQLWTREGGRRGANQLAATEKFTWPLPSEPADPYDLMSTILGWERGRG